MAAIFTSQVCHVPIPSSDSRSANYDSRVITVMGEALIDIIIDADGELTSVIGGGELNTARAIARLGVPVQFLGGISTDPLGQRIHRSLEDDSIILALPAPVNAPTTLAIAQIAHDGSATYRFLLDATSMAAVEPAAALAAIPSTCDFLHVGSIGLAVEPFAHAAVAVVESSPETRLVMVDPNFRPAISGMSPLFRQSWDSILPRADILKASTEDLEFMYPGRAPLDSARALHEEFDLAALVTDGNGDVWVISSGGAERCAVPKVDVIDTVGAGDSFSGGFAAWWILNGFGRGDVHDTEKLIRAANAGIAVAAANCSRAGANPPLLSDLPKNWAT
jgi:fructokinase